MTGKQIFNITISPNALKADLVQPAIYAEIINPQKIVLEHWSLFLSRVNQNLKIELEQHAFYLSRINKTSSSRISTNDLTRVLIKPQNGVGITRESSRAPQI